MLCSGQWAQAIVAFGPRTVAAFERHLAVSRQCTNGTEQQFGMLPAVSTETAQASLSARKPDVALGVEVNSEIVAVAVYSLCGPASNKQVMRLLIGVAHDHRRQGIGTALLMRCTAIARQAGVRSLVLEDIDAEAAHSACLASADLVFNDGECQGWIDLAPLKPVPATQEYAELPHV